MSLVDIDNMSVGELEDNPIVITILGVLSFLTASPVVAVNWMSVYLSVCPGCIEITFTLKSFATYLTIISMLNGLA